MRDVYPSPWGKYTSVYPPDSGVEDSPFSVSILTVNPLLSLPGGLFFSSTNLRVGVIERGGLAKIPWLAFSVGIYRLPISSSQDQELVGHLLTEFFFS